MTPALTPQLGLLGSPPDPVGRLTMREGPSPAIVCDSCSRYVGHCRQPNLARARVKPHAFQTASTTPGMHIENFELAVACGEIIVFIPGDAGEPQTGARVAW